MRPLACAYCSGTDGPFHDDHVVPRSRGGPDTPTNLVKACATCNSKKRDLLPSEWLPVVPELVAAIEKRITLQLGNKIAGRRDWKRGKQHVECSLRCYFCAGYFKKLTDGFLQFADIECGPPYLNQPQVVFNEHGGRAEVGVMWYPGGSRHAKGRWERIAFLSHTGCGPETYWVNLEQLLQQGFEHWHQHLMRKDWWFVEGFLFMQHVAKEARSLRGARDALALFERNEGRRKAAGLKEWWE